MAEPMCLLIHCLMVTMGEGCLITVITELKLSVSVLLGGVAERSGHCSFCLADYRGKALEGIMKSDE